MKWFFVRYAIDLETASDKRIWLWTFTAPVLTSFVGIAIAILQLTRGNWFAAILWFAGTLLVFFIMFRLRLRITLPIMARRHADTWGQGKPG